MIDIVIVFALFFSIVIPKNDSKVMSNQIFMILKE